MRDEIIIEYKDNYIHVRHYGKNNYDISLDLWRRVKAMCDQYNCFNILGENYTTDELSTMDAFNHIKILELVGLTLKHRIAWVNQVKETAKGIEFVETVVIKNRGLVNGGIFSSVEEAKLWLLGKENE
ncbi:MAG: hypothetical protein CVU62_10305 [Deltaproteobacteria bacterium HGW-Deltaproteobacteria-2]|jgi:hypothetical protein|nr:MAG: hypothetical protein CVU62_10305 [Deltaproteobacteria bacterium HGW-Deltaproteobacteria-2]